MATIHDVLKEYRKLDEERAAAKMEVLQAIGRAKAAEYKGEDSASDWAIVDAQGINGVEGEKRAAMQAVADKAVKDYPEAFSHLAQYKGSADGQESLVKMANMFGKSGMKDEKLIVTLFELAHFERQEIGVRAQVKIRIP